MNRPARVAFSLVMLAGSAPAGAADGGFTSPVYEACREYESAPPAEATDAGWLLSPARASLVACRLASCEAAINPEPPTATGYLVAGSVALVVGLAGGVALGLALRK